MPTVFLSMLAGTFLIFQQVKKLVVRTCGVADVVDRGGQTLVPVFLELAGSAGKTQTPDQGVGIEV